MMYFILLIFFVTIFVGLNKGNMSSPHVLPQLCFFLNSTPAPPTLPFGWLLRFFTDWCSPKAWVLPITLFLNGLHFGTLSKGTSCSNCKPASRLLQRTHGESRSHDLAPWQKVPWQYGAKMLGVEQGDSSCFCLLCGNPKSLKNVPSCHKM
jgi:hypothetical protein